MADNDLITEDEFKQIPLTKGKFAIVDFDDFEFLSQWKWQIGHGKYGQYARRSSATNGKRICIFIHRIVTNAPENMKVDHINGDTLDNRKSNLRICTNAENCRNQKKMENATSKFKGVSWHKPTQMWQSRITLNRKTIHLGIWSTEEDAADAYNKAASIYHGAFSKINT